MANALKWLSLIVASLIGYWTNLDAVYQTLIVFMVLDIVSGVIRASIQKELISEVAYKGIFKKGGELVLIGMALFLQRTTGLDGIPLPQTLAGFYIYVEGLSILENAAAVGVPIPQFLRDALAKLSPEKQIPPEGVERRANLRKG